MVILTMDDKISLGQCFNLAHEESLHNQRITKKDDFIKIRALELFKLKKDIQRTLEE